jgi:resuscitation-promoting factor RpfA
VALNDHNTDGLERDPRLDRLYAGTRLEEPRAALDAAIRAAARREVQARPHALGARLRRWRLPISIAAVIVLSASVVTLMREEGADRYEEAFRPRAAEPTGPAVPPLDDADLKAKERADAPGRVQRPPPQAPPAPAAGFAAPSVEDTRRARQPDAPPAQGVKPAEPFTAEIRRRAADAVNESTSRRPTSAAEAPEEKPQPGAARVLGAPASSIPAAPLEAESESAGTRALKKSERPLMESRVDALIRELEEAPPKAWLEKIALLRREGRHAEGDELVAEFKRRFPQHPVPIQEGARGE